MMKNLVYGLLVALAMLATGCKTSGSDDSEPQNPTIDEYVGTWSLSGSGTMKTTKNGDESTTTTETWTMETGKTVTITKSSATTVKITGYYNTTGTYKDGKLTVEQQKSSTTTNNVLNAICYTFTPWTLSDGKIAFTWGYLQNLNKLVSPYTYAVAAGTMSVVATKN